MSKHTKGPWRWVLMGNWWELRGADGSTVCDDGSAGGEYCKALDPAGHNGLLIAAAPELLEALEAFVAKRRQTYGLDGAWDDELVKAEAAIAKAKGEQ